MHIQILSKLKTELESHCQKAVGPDHAFTEDEQFRMLFENYRKVNNQPYGLRLTGFGNKMLSKHYECYKYTHEERILNKAYIVLDKSMKWPYYLGKQIVTFYSHEDAAWFRLNGQDLNKFIDYM